MKALSFLIKFWQEHPALFYGIVFLLGFYGALEQSFLLLIPCIALWFPFILSAIKGDSRTLKQLALSLLLIFTSWVYGSTLYQFPTLPQEGVQGTAYLSIKSLVLQSNYFNKSWLYQCQLKDFFSHDHPDLSLAHHLECYVSISDKKHLKRPPAYQDYLVKGTLTQTSKGHYVLEIDKKDEWKPVKNSWSLAEIRYQAKQAVKILIHQSITHSKTASFLTGLATGEFDDSMTQETFIRFGLQHIMAISGFHFAIVAAILSFFLRFIVSRKINALFMILLLGAYFLFLGCSPSILRSWIMISISMIGQLIDKQGKALNSLGIALLGVLGFNPLLCQTLGFQYSFLVTASILLLGSTIDYYLTYILPKRPLSIMVEMNGWNQHGYYFLSLFRQGLALTLAVNTFCFPLTLYYFQKFPWISILYNFFFPILISFSMFLLLMGFFTFPFSFLSHLIHSGNDLYTTWVLSLTYNIPESMDIYCKINSFPTWILITYLCLISIGSIIIPYWLKEKREKSSEFIFIYS